MKVTEPRAASVRTRVRGSWCSVGLGVPVQLLWRITYLFIYITSIIIDIAGKCTTATLGGWGGASTFLSGRVARHSPGRADIVRVGQGSSFAPVASGL